VEKLEIEGDKDRLEINVKHPEHSRRDGDAFLTIRVPRSGRLDIGTVSADVKVSDVDGRLTIDSVSGDIEAQGKPSEVETNTVSGDVNTFSGDIVNDFGSDGERTSKFAPGSELHFTTGSGTAEVGINTFSGDIRLKKK